MGLEGKRFSLNEKETNWNNLEKSIREVDETSYSAKDIYNNDVKEIAEKSFYMGTMLASDVDVIVEKYTNLGIEVNAIDVYNDIKNMYEQIKAERSVPQIEQLKNTNLDNNIVNSTINDNSDYYMNNKEYYHDIEQLAEKNPVVSVIDDADLEELVKKYQAIGFNISKDIIRKNIEGIQINKEYEKRTNMSSEQLISSFVDPDGKSR